MNKRYDDKWDREYKFINGVLTVDGCMDRMNIINREIEATENYWQYQQGLRYIPLKDNDWALNLYMKLTDEMKQEMKPDESLEEFIENTLTKGAQNVQNK